MDKILTKANQTLEKLKLSEADIRLTEIINYLREKNRIPALNAMVLGYAKNNRIGVKWMFFNLEGRRFDGKDLPELSTYMQINRWNELKRVDKEGTPYDGRELYKKEWNALIRKQPKNAVFIMPEGTQMAAKNGKPLILGTYGYGSWLALYAIPSSSFAARVPYFESEQTIQMGKTLPEELTEPIKKLIRVLE